MANKPHQATAKDAWQLLPLKARKKKKNTVARRKKKNKIVMGNRQQQLPGIMSLLMVQHPTG